MTFKTKTKTKIKLFLRRLGFLCKKPIYKKQLIKLSKTIYPGGKIIAYDTPLEKVPENLNSFNAEVHVFLEEKKLSSKNCAFDTNTKTCVCGTTLDEFLISKCKKTK